jgi:hypothetical protein
VGTGFRKRSCSDNKLERDDDSKKSHPAPEHDPEKWVPVFGKDHAPTTSWSGMTIRRKVISLQSMIPKSGYRFSEKIMLQQQAGAG